LIIVADPKLKSAGTQERKNDRGTMGWRGKENWENNACFGYIMIN
jgi:hypothetical protein